MANSWSKSLDEIRDLVFAIPNKNSATNYARNYIFVHRKKWHVKIVSCHRPNQLINCPAGKYKDWENDAIIKIQTGTELLHKKIAEFSTNGTPNIPKFQNITQINMQISRENTNEHEHIRERTK